jgi:hypothetical protein
MTVGVGIYSPRGSWRGLERLLRFKIAGDPAQQSSRVDSWELAGAIVGAAPPTLAVIVHNGILPGQCVTVRPGAGSRCLPGCPASQHLGDAVGVQIEQDWLDHESVCAAPDGGGLVGAVGGSGKDDDRQQ